MTTYFVVRHKPTGALLPARVHATYHDFEHPSAGTNEPRLFATARAAKNCATCWAQGVWTRESRTESEGWEFPSYTYLAEPAPSAVPERRREDVEVVPVSLELLP